MFTFRFHLRQRTVPVLLHLPCASALLPKAAVGSSGGLPRGPKLLAILFGSSARCPDCKNPSLCPLHLSKPKRLGLLVFSRFITYDRFVQLLVIVLHGFFVCPLDTLKWPGKWHASPHPRAVTTIFCVDERSMHLLFSARSVSSSAPSRITASGKSVVNFGFDTFLDSMFFSKSPTFTASRLSTVMNLLSPSLTLSRLFFGKPCTTMLTGLSPSFCWFAKSLSALIKLSPTPCGAA